MKIYLTKIEREVLLGICKCQIDCERSAQHEFPEHAELFKLYEMAWRSLRKKLRKRRTHEG